MIYSMTGYANKVFQIGTTTLQVDIRSVNQRFLDLTIKCPEEFKALEHDIREKITAIVSRGKIDLRIHYNEHDTDKAQLNIDALKHYIGLTEQIKEFLPQANLENINQILTLPGILNVKTVDIESIKGSFLTQISTLTSELQESQLIEGYKLADILLDKVNHIEKIVQSASNIIPTVKEAYKNRLKQKLLDVLADVENNEQRFSQEFAYFCQKIDVEEELSRLGAHTKAFRDLLIKGGAIGKKLDFMTQEMHREANTFGSKSAALETTTHAIELKVLIEQIKEQVQNIM
ncbi:MAG: YicC family protein [Burkholderiales bacterium]|jgi:uncharacterized protein (TIGR00255 family)|nr:YicC family protein [Burkholderiales bacterium]